MLREQSILSMGKNQDENSVGHLALLSNLKQNAQSKTKQNIRNEIIPSQFSTNNTLLYYQGSQKPIYYLAAYVRAKVISISNINYQEMSAKLNCQFFIDISYRGLRQSEKNDLLSQGIRLSFQTDQSVLLSKSNADVSIYDYQSQKRVQYVIRRFVQTRISSDNIRFSPFQVIKCHIGVKINKVKIQIEVQEFKDIIKKDINQDQIVQSDYKPKQQQTSKIKTSEKKNQKDNNNNNNNKNKKQLKIPSFLQAQKQKKNGKQQQQIYEYDQKFAKQLKQNIKQPHYVNAQIHFNMMDHQDEKIKIATSIDCDFGIFQIAAKQLRATYSNSFVVLQDYQKQQIRQAQLQQQQILQKKKKKKNKIKKTSNNKQVAASDSAERFPLLKKQYGKQKLQQYNVALFQVPLYKKPNVAALTIFLPLLVLAITNLGIFYQQPDMKTKIASISATMVSFVALIPTIRQQIPPTPKITIVQILVFIQAITTIFALGDSIIYRNQDPNNWHYNGWQNTLFVLSFILTVLVNLTIFILMMLYVCVWRPRYVDLNSLIAAGVNRTQQINMFSWRNIACDRYFELYHKRNLVHVIEDVQFINQMYFKNIFIVGLAEKQREMDMVKKQEF